MKCVKEKEIKISFVPLGELGKRAIPGNPFKEGGDVTKWIMSTHSHSPSQHARSNNRLIDEEKKNRNPPHCAIPKHTQHFSFSSLSHHLRAILFSTKPFCSHKNLRLCKTRSLSYRPATRRDVPQQPLSFFGGWKTLFFCVFFSFRKLRIIPRRE